MLDALGKLERIWLRLMAAVTPARSGVTVVVTSCSRHALLEKTLESFFSFNSFPVTRIIIVEDGEGIAEDLAVKFARKPISWISTGTRVGQIAAIDYAYSRVKTPYIFHMEDDWEFYEPGFIEKSMQILRRNPRCLQVWLRALDDTNLHPVAKETHDTRGVLWRKLAWDYENAWGTWHGFSFNPGLRRTADYVAINGYGRVSSFDFHDPGNAEIAIGKFYRDRAFYAAILCDKQARGYVRHIGQDQHVGPPDPHSG